MGLACALGVIAAPGLPRAQGVRGWAGSVTPSPDKEEPLAGLEGCTLPRVGLARLRWDDGSEGLAVSRLSLSARAADWGKGAPSEGMSTGISLLEPRPEIRRDYPLNLSILVSGGKETNQDSLSNGE